MSFSIFIHLKVSKAVIGFYVTSLCVAFVESSLGPELYDVSFNCMCTHKHSFLSLSRKSICEHSEIDTAE